MKPLVLILFLLTTLFGYSQEQSQLLWFSGKKLAPNVLLLSKGDTVRYNSTKFTLVRSSPKTNRNRLDEMRLELDQTDIRIKEKIRFLAARLPKPAVPTVSLLVKEAYENLNKEMAPLFDNRLLLPDAGLPEAMIKGRGPAAAADEELFPLFRKALDEILEYARRRASEKTIYVPTPPRVEYDYCQPCRTKRQEQRNGEMRVFNKEMGGEDTRVLEHLLGISRQAEFLLTEKEKKVLMPDMAMALDLLMKKATEKVQVLLEKYGDDPHRIPALLEIAFAVDRHNQLMGIDAVALAPEKLQAMFTTMVRYFIKAIDENDYGVALNIQLALGMDRQAQLIGLKQVEPVVARAMKFNQFKMNAHISAKISGNGGYLLSELDADNWFFASPDTTCRLKWFVIGPELNRIKGNLKEAEWKGNGASIPYAGPRDWFSDIPKIRMDFVHMEAEAEDTVEIYQFDAKDFDEKWTMPPPMGVTKLLQVNTTMMNCFIDVEALKEQAAEFKADPKKLEAMKKEMMSKYTQMMKDNRMNSFPNEGNMTVMDMRMVANLQDNSRRISEMIHTPAAGKYVFHPQLQNKTTEVLREKLNGKLLFPQNTATEYAFFHLMMDHDPDGPYSISF